MHYGINMNKVSNNQIPFGLKDGVLLHVSDVVSGLACGCICPECHGKLQANKGSSGKRAHYFSHDPSSNTDECKSAFETSIHLMAKQILEKRKKATFPELELTMSMDDESGKNHTEKIEITPKTSQEFTDVRLEKRLEDIRPDIIGYTLSQEPILIEVAVTNFSNAEKKEKIRNLSLRAIEIDLSSVSYDITEEKLEKLVLEEVNNKKWLSYPEAIQAKIELHNKLKQKVNDANYSIAASKKANSERLSGQRWFVCEACGHVFRKSSSEVPYSIGTTTIGTTKCPECNYHVSTIQAV
jgi:hypothetical protein